MIWKLLWDKGQSSIPLAKEILTITPIVDFLDYVSYQVKKQLQSATVLHLMLRPVTYWVSNQILAKCTLGDEHG